jgi:hypothetical protein
MRFRARGRQSTAPAGEATTVKGLRGGDRRTGTPSLSPFPGGCHATRRQPVSQPGTVRASGRRSALPGQNGGGTPLPAHLGHAHLLGSLPRLPKLFFLRARCSSSPGSAPPRVSGSSPLPGSRPRADPAGRGGSPGVRRRARAVQRP